jgi:uncharacterized protein
MKQKKVPLRKCVGCNEHSPKKDLIRVVKSKDGEVFIDVTGKANGRGAYICIKAECLKKAQKRDSLSRALETKVDKALYEKLINELVQKESELAELKENDEETDGND